AGLIIQEAENKAREILNQARLQVEKAERYQSDLEARAAAFKMRLRSFLLAQLELLAGEEAAATCTTGAQPPDEGEQAASVTVGVDPGI
ncbi:MAG: hypothetical protein H5T99_05290, partial [Moorella sp. (in: Bacteria)]|nr:hypothetical protein [Moorella sp. (in: firmicutes)]